MSRHSLPQPSGKSSVWKPVKIKRKEAPMVYSHTQISQYIRCPRAYRYRYLDGWREKDTRAAMVFGRCFEKALGAYFEQQDCTAILFKEWGAFRDAPFEYRKADSWDRLAPPGARLLLKIPPGGLRRVFH